MNIRFAHKHRGTKWDPTVIAKAVGLDVSEVLQITKEASFGIDPSDYEYVSAQDVRRFVERVQKYPEYRSLLCALGDFIPLDAPAKLTDFLCLHNFIDLFCWLIKLRYSDRETVKTKRFSYDGLLLNFLADRKIDLSRLRRLGGSRNSPEKMLFYLQKGWYDELWRSSFSKNEGLRLTTSIGYDFAKNASPVWNVVQSYYAHYNYLSALVFTNVDQLRTQEHQKAPKYFYNNLLTKFEQKLVCYPFSLRAPNLSEGDISRLRGPEKDFWRFKYARCSRNPNESIKSIEARIGSALLSKQHLTNVLYEFRVWANYTGADSVVLLENDFMNRYLSKNLGLIVYFYGVFAELMSLALLGERDVVRTLRNFVENQVLKNEHFAEHQFLIPMSVRFRIYQRYGLLTEDLSFLIPPSDDPLA